MINATTSTTAASTTSSAMNTIAGKTIVDGEYHESTRLRARIDSLQQRLTRFETHNSLLVDAILALLDLKEILLYEVFGSSNARIDQKIDKQLETLKQLVRRDPDCFAFIPAELGNFDRETKEIETIESNDLRSKTDGNDDGDDDDDYDRISSPVSIVSNHGDDKINAKTNGLLTTIATTTTPPASASTISTNDTKHRLKNDNQNKDDEDEDEDEEKVFGFQSLKCFTSHVDNGRLLSTTATASNTRSVSTLPINRKHLLNGRGTPVVAKRLRLSAIQTSMVDINQQQQRKSFSTYPLSTSSPFVVLDISSRPGTTSSSSNKMDHQLEAEKSSSAESDDMNARRSSRIAIRSLDHPELAHPGRLFQKMDRSISSAARLRLDEASGSRPGGRSEPSASDDNHRYTIYGDDSDDNKRDNEIDEEYDDDVDDEEEDDEDDDYDHNEIMPPIGGDDSRWRPAIYGDPAEAIPDAEGPELSNPIRTISIICTDSVDGGAKECGERFAKRADLDRHRADVHRSLPLRCLATLCDSQFDTGEQLRDHNFSAHRSITWWRCRQCQCETKSSASLRAHIWSMHERGEFACDIADCDFRCASTRAAIIMHQRRAHSIGRFICRFRGCDRTFDKRGHYSTHIRIHTGEKPFACSLCGRTFNVKTNMQRHVLIHTQRKRFACKWNTCDHETLDMANIIRHIRTRHFRLPATVKEQMQRGISDHRNARDFVRRLSVD